MYLAEAVKEMEFIRDSISSIQRRIESLMIVKGGLDFESSKELLKEKFKSLDELYRKLQHFAVTVERAKSNAVIQVKETKLSLADAMTLRDVMKEKLVNLENILHSAGRTDKEDVGTLCLDLEEVYIEVESVRLDIKTLEGDIGYALWQVEI